MLRRSLRSMRSMPMSSATRKTMSSTPFCTSVRPRSLLRRTDPMSDTVTRTGMPVSPSMSQMRQGQPRNLTSAGLRPKVSAHRFSMKLVIWPDSAMPVTSPLTSAMKTGTPAAENPSAMTLRVTVLPVPDAPAMSPCRFAWLSSRLHGVSPCAIQILSSMSMGLLSLAVRGAPSCLAACHTFNHNESTRDSPSCAKSGAVRTSLAQRSCQRDELRGGEGLGTGGGSDARVCEGHVQR